MSIEKIAAPKNRRFTVNTARLTAGSAVRKYTRARHLSSSSAQLPQRQALFWAYPAKISTNYTTQQQHLRNLATRTLFLTPQALMRKKHSQILYWFAVQH